MRNFIEISRKNILHNYDVFHSLSDPSVVAPVLKSNAYGHGLAEVYSILSERKVPWLCVNYVYEAAVLRAKGFAGHILAVGPTAEAWILWAFKLDVDLTIGNRTVLDYWKSEKSQPRIHIKFDTGMSRQGFAPEDAISLAKELQNHREKIAGVATHFANVEDVLNFEYPLQQLASFQKAAAVFKNTFPDILRHSASSASTLILEESRLDLCRIGISLYGQWPSSLTRISYLQKNQALIELKPAMRWLTEVDSVKDVPKGMYVGYGCTYRAPQAMRIAVLPVGYFEGYPRVAGENHSYVLLRGSRCQIVGRICMNMMMVDISHLENVRVGELVVLLGTDGEERIGSEDLGKNSHTIDYEILSRLNPDIPRKIVET